MDGFAQLSKQITQLKNVNDTALKQAISQTGIYAKNQFADDIYGRYNFKDKSKAQSALKLDINDDQFSVKAKHKTINAISFMGSPVYRLSKNKRTPGKQVLAGYTVSYLRGKLTHQQGFFTFIGKNNNLLMGNRPKGNKTRGIPQTPYGPSIAGAFAVIKEHTAPQILDFLNASYHKALHY